MRVSRVTCRGGEQRVAVALTLGDGGAVVAVPLQNEAAAMAGVLARLPT